MGTRAKISVALYRGPEAKTPVAFYRGPEADDFRRPLLWARGRRFPSPLTVGTRAKSCRLYREQAYRGHEGGDSRRLHREQELRARLLPWGRGRRFPSPFTVGPRLKIPDRGPDVEDCPRPLPWARVRRFPSPFTVVTRPKIPVAPYRGHEAEDSRRPLQRARVRSPVVVTVSKRIVDTRAKIPVVSTVSGIPALAFYRGDEGEDFRRP